MDFQAIRDKLVSSCLQEIDQNTERTVYLNGAIAGINTFLEEVTHVGESSEPVESQEEEADAGEGS